MRHEQMQTEGLRARDGRRILCPPRCLPWGGVEVFREGQRVDPAAYVVERYSYVPQFIRGVVLFEPDPRGIYSLRWVERRMALPRPRVQIEDQGVTVVSERPPDSMLEVLAARRPETIRLPYALVPGPSASLPRDCLAVVHWRNVTTGARSLASTLVRVAADGRTSKLRKAGWVDVAGQAVEPRAPRTASP